MTIRARIVGVSGLLAVALGCSDSAGPENRSLGGPRFDVSAGSVNGTLGETTLLIKGFDGGNPRQGDAIIATFVWLGSTDVINSVTDVKTTNPYTPIGNKFNRVEYVTSGGISMATYVATNVQAVVTDGYVHAVEANLSQPVTDGGVVISAWSGVYPTFATALGAHRSASGSGSTSTVADPGSIPVAAGALAYGVSMSNGALALDRTVGFTSIGTGSDAAMVVDGEFA